MSDLLSKLRERYTEHTHPDVTTTVEQSLIQLSRGIYTEEERFIFELLQNAVDAYTTDDGCLNITLVIKNHHLIFMHNGNAFSDRDVEGLCDIGNGNKMKDIKKIGYKGIGFKSVFMRSKCVTVESGKYCFKFDKDYWNGYWDKNWNDNKYGAKDCDKEYAMPWQIIPVSSTPPVDIDTDSYNVATYIEIEKEKTLCDKISKLLKSSQFLLFLKSNDIHISFIYEGNILSDISKTTKDGIVYLSSHGKTKSKWLIHTNKNVEVPSDIVKSISEDVNTPDKLKGVKSFDLSFAIAIEKKGLVRKLEQDESVVYTYLPTSFKFGKCGLPFLVNANFITDAGRQQLHKDSEWNRYIFSKIPSEYLNWIADISSTYSNYFEVLPMKSYGTDNELEKAFASNMSNAINKIAFIPCRRDSNIKLLAKNAVMDRMGISSNIDEGNFISHINRTYDKKFNTDSIIDYYWKSIKILSEYGVFVFGKDQLKTIFEDKEVFSNIDTEYNLKLIKYLCKLCSNEDNKNEGLLSVISNTKFLLAENGTVQAPCDIYFPNDYKEQNEVAKDILFLDPNLYRCIDDDIKKWLVDVGVGVLSNETFIHYLCFHEYINADNALEIGRFIFNVSKEEDIFNYKDTSIYLKYISFLTKEGSIKSAYKLYMGSLFKPEFDIEPIVDDDIFISEEYCENGNINEWKMFFLKMGINEDIKINDYTYKFYLYLNDEKKRYDHDFFMNAKKGAEKYGWVTFCDFALKDYDYSFNASSVSYYSFPFMEKAEDHKFSKLIFSRIFIVCKPEEISGKDIYVNGCTGIVQRCIAPKLLRDINCETNHFKWIVKNCNILPTVQNCCCMAKDIYSNRIPKIHEIAGKYLPVLDVSMPISEEWQTYLNLKTYLCLDDYLTILTGIANDEEHCEENRQRAALVYSKIVESGALDTEENVNKLKEWGDNNRIITNDNKLDYPKNLAYITVDGFSSKSKVYTGTDTDEEVIRLLKIMGIDIINEDNITPSFVRKQESNGLKDILLDNISYLTIIACGKNCNEEMFITEKARLEGLLHNAHFFECKSIILSLGDSEEHVKRQTFSHGNNFYFTGEINPCIMEALSTAVCDYLGMRNKEKEILLLMLDDNDGILENFKDKGYDVSLIKKEGETSSTDKHDNRFVTDADNTTYFKGCITIYEKLKAMGYNPSCPSIFSSEDNSEVINNGDSVYHCNREFEKYDISFSTHGGSEMMIRVMATKHQKEYLEHLPLSTTELEMIDACDDSKEKSFVIAHVTGIDSDNQMIYLFKAHTLK